MVEVARSAQLWACLLPLAEPGIERAQATVAVGLERAHAQLLGEGEGLAIVAGGGLALGGHLARRTLTQEPQGPGLGAAELVLAGEIARLRSALARLFQAA